MPIPCTGDKVIEYPNKFPAGPIGEKVRLGYLMQHGTSGKWIGLIGNGERHSNLNNAGVAEMQKKGDIPPTPNHSVSVLTKPGVLWVKWLWLCIFAIAIPAGIKSKSAKAA